MKNRFNYWKLIAIISIILLVLVLIFMYKSYERGMAYFEREDTCMNLCEAKEATSYSLEAETICSCFNREGKNIFSEVLK